MFMSITETDVVEAVKIYLGNFPDVDRVDTEIKFITDGLTCDVVGIQASQIKYIVECKGELSPGGIAGGLGQAYQYTHQKDFLNTVDSNSKVMFACPINAEPFLNLMKIPNEISDILLVDGQSSVRTYKKTRSNSGEIMLHIAGTTYLEGMSIERIKHVLEVLVEIQNKNDKRTKFDILIKKRIPEVKDTRNLLISINTLGISKDFQLTQKGYALYGSLKNSDIAFKMEMQKILEPTLSVILNAIIIFAKNEGQTLSEIKFTLQQLEEQIEEIFGEKVNYFDYRRLGQPVLMLCELGFLNQIRKGVYSLLKVNFN